MPYKLLVTHKPSGNNVEYGPWEVDENKDINLGRMGFAQGFVMGTEFARRGEEYDVTEYDFKIQEVEPETPGAKVVGNLVASASALVTHPDGTTD